MLRVPALLLACLPSRGLVILILPSGCAGSTELILFQMEGFTSVKILCGLLRRWDDVSVIEFHILTSVLRTALLKMCC